MRGKDLHTQAYKSLAEDGELPMIKGKTGATSGEQGIWDPEDT